MSGQVGLILAGVAAFLISAAVVAVASVAFWGESPSTGLAGWQQLSGRLSLTFVVALAHCFILGLPAFLLIQRKRHVNFLTSAIGGLVIGALPLGIISFLSLFTPDSASTDGIPTVVNHVPTLFGFIELLKFILFLGLLGLMGGCVFWAVMRTTGALSQINLLPITNTSIIRSVAAFLLATGVAGVILVLFPRLVEDRSCHNMFR